MDDDSDITAAPAWISSDGPSVPDLWILPGGLEELQRRLAVAIAQAGDGELDDAILVEHALRGTLQ